jgi:two-component system response regulator YesN
MVVLVVDDQINVVSGIIFGVKWDSIGVHKVLKAYHATEAKQIINSQEVDIMLCDIEMPVENGLQLFRWVKEQKKEIECIFLTAHADFIYAKEAVMLGSFDYILQPARYSEIEDIIIKAIKKINMKKELNKFYSYGKMLYDQKDKFLEALLKDWILSDNPETGSMVNNFEKLNIRINANTPLYIILISFMKWEDRNNPWDSELLCWSVNNILSEIFGNYEQNILLLQMDCGLLGSIVYPKNQLIMEDMTVERQLGHFTEAASAFFKCSISVYTGEKLPLDGVHGRIKELMKMKTDNIALKDQVFFYGERRPEEIKSLDLSVMKVWANLLLEGYPGAVYQEAVSYLDEKMKAGALNGQNLKQFYQKFMKMIYTVAEKSNYTADEIFGDEEVQDMVLHSYTSLEEMKKLIQYTASYFNCPAASSGETKKQIEQIKEFISENLDRDIRRTDIAKAIFLNPNYLSRLFKNEEGISLKAYIVTEKMKVAQVLLRTTDLTVSIIAAKIGYSNFSHFSQVYKKIIGISPTDERLK